MSKITKATFKSFIKKNKGDLLIKVKSTFDGMTDGCVAVHDGWKQAEMTESFVENTCGVKGVWLVGGSRDYFTAYEKNGVKGISVYNCCGSFVVAVASV